LAGNTRDTYACGVKNFMQWRLDAGVPESVPTDETMVGIWQMDMV
jgi:hypothetical protein